MYNLIIKNGLIIDGKKNAAVRGDLGIEGERIASVGKIEASRAERIICAEGLFVCPGFVDVHGHSDFTLLADPRAESKIRQGVTTEVGGNCGFSAGPRFGEATRQAASICKDYELKDNWNSLGQYLSLLERRGLGVNFVPLVGHGNLRTSVLGYEDRQATANELEEMKQMLRDSMSEGSFGISSGLIYPPGCFTPTKEITELCKVAACFNGIYSTHLRSEGKGLLEAIDEAIEIGKEAGVAVQISHLKASDKKNWAKLDKAFEKIEMALREGVKISCDRYPYTASSTDLDAVLPNYAFAGGREAQLGRLRDKWWRAKIKKEMEKTYPEGCWEGVMISSVRSKQNKWMEGKRISRIAKHKDMYPVDFLLDLLLEEETKVSAIFFTMCEDNLRRILKKPYTMVGSDSSARSTSGILAKGKPHPRGFGTFPRILRRYVLEEGLLSIQEAVYKMTAQPMKLLGIQDRGTVEEGKYADLVIFDKTTIKDCSTYESPYRYPEGIRYVILNGKIVIEDGKYTGRLAGKILRKNR